MNQRLDDAVELLDRALSYTRVALASVSDEVLAAPTPCQAWDLAALLTHMEDSPDTFAAGGRGAISVSSSTTKLRKAPWSGPPTGSLS